MLHPQNTYLVLLVVQGLHLFHYRPANVFSNSSRHGSRASPAELTAFIFGKNWMRRFRCASGELVGHRGGSRNRISSFAQKLFPASTDPIRIPFSSKLRLFH